MSYQFIINFIFICLLSSFSLVAQEELKILSNTQGIHISIDKFQGIATNQGGQSFNGGTGLSIEYERIFKKVNHRFGLGFRTINWGNQVSFNYGIDLKLHQAHRWNVVLHTDALLGIALYRKPLPTYGLHIGPAIQYQLGKKAWLKLGTGIRFTTSPAYKKYSQVNQLWEVPITLTYAWRW